MTAQLSAERVRVPAETALAAHRSPAGIARRSTAGAEDGLRPAFNAVVRELENLAAV